MYKNYKKIRDKKFLKMRWEVYTIYRIAREMSYYTINSREGGANVRRKIVQLPFKLHHYSIKK